MSTQNPLAHPDTESHAPPSGATQMPGVAVLLGAQTLPAGQVAVEQHTLFPPPASTQCPPVQSVSLVHNVPSAPVDLQAPSSPHV